MRYAIYEPVIENQAYRIKHCLIGSSESVMAQISSSELMVVVGDSVSNAKHYLSMALDPELRPESPLSVDRFDLLADGVSASVLSDLLPDTRIEITGPVDDTFVASSSTALRFVLPGLYQVRVSAPFPYYPVEVTIHAE